MPSPSKYSVKNVNLILEAIYKPLPFFVSELIVSDKDLRIKISEVTGLIHKSALTQFINSMEELDYIVKSGKTEWKISYTRDDVEVKKPYPVTSGGFTDESG